MKFLLTRSTALTAVLAAGTMLGAAAGHAGQTAAAEQQTSQLTEGEAAAGTITAPKEEQGAVITDQEEVKEDISPDSLAVPGHVGTETGEALMAPTPDVQTEEQGDEAAGQIVAPKEEQGAIITDREEVKEGITPDSPAVPGHVGTETGEALLAPTPEPELEPDDPQAPGQIVAPKEEPTRFTEDEQVRGPQTTAIPENVGTERGDRVTAPREGSVLQQEREPGGLAD